MDRREHVRRELGFDELSTLARDAKAATEQRLCRGCAETDEDVRFTTVSSASSHGRQAEISDHAGFAWIRRLPRSCHLKCLTTFVT